jgi:hypothetical protein
VGIEPPQLSPLVPPVAAHEVALRLTQEMLAVWPTWIELGTMAMAMTCAAGCTADTTTLMDLVLLEPPGPVQASA